MKKDVFLQFTFTALIILLVGCSGPKDPTFEKIENIMVKSITKNKVVLTGNIILNNPNPFSCHLKDLQLDIFSDKDIKLTEIFQTYNTEMLAKSNFKLPVQISFSPDKLLDEKVGLLSSIASVLGEKEVELKYKGHCNVEAMEITINIPIDFEEVMVLKK